MINGQDVHDSSRWRDGTLANEAARGDFVRSQDVDGRGEDEAHQPGVWIRSENKPVIYGTPLMRHNLLRRNLKGFGIGDGSTTTERPIIYNQDRLWT